MHEQVDGVGALLQKDNPAPSVRAYSKMTNKLAYIGLSVMMITYIQRSAKPNQKGGQVGEAGKYTRSTSELPAAETAEWDLNPRPRAS